jgi:hypothetical protein
MANIVFAEAGLVFMESPPNKNVIHLVWEMLPQCVGQSGETLSLMLEVRK